MSPRAAGGDAQLVVTAARLSVVPTFQPGSFWKRSGTNFSACETERASDVLFLLCTRVSREQLKLIHSFGDGGGRFWGHLIYQLIYHLIYHLSTAG